MGGKGPRGRRVGEQDRREGGGWNNNDKKKGNQTPGKIKQCEIGECEDEKERESDKRRCFWDLCFDLFMCFCDCIILTEESKCQDK